MGILDHLTCLLRNLNAGQEATIRTGHGTMDWFQIGKGIHPESEQTLGSNEEGWNIACCSPWGHKESDRT